MTKKIKICLTGGIASGKTYVSDKLNELGVCIIDADILARKVVEKDSYGLSQLCQEFSREILSENGTLNRSYLKNIVFGDEDKLARLNGILHPLIRKEFEAISQKNINPIEVWVIPLFEGKPPYDIFDRVLVVDVPQEVQVKRIKNRDGASNELALKIIQSQPSREQRLNLATDVISNRFSFEKLDSNIKQIHNLYNNLSGY